MNQVLESEVLCVVLEHQTLQIPQKRAEQFRWSLETLLEPWHRTKSSWTVPKAPLKMGRICF